MGSFCLKRKCRIVYLSLGGVGWGGGRGKIACLDVDMAAKSTSNCMKFRFPIHFSPISSFFFFLIYNIEFLL